MLKNLVNKAGVMDDSESIVHIPIVQIGKSPKQARRLFDTGELDELAASIREHGILQPLAVTPNEKGEYWLIHGERRWRAAQIAHLVTVPCIVRDATPLQLMVWGLIENEQRADLNAMERAIAYQALADEFGMSHEDIAASVGKARTTVTNTLRLLRLPENVREVVLSGQLDESSARELLRIDGNPDVVGSIAQGAVVSKLGKRDIAYQVDMAIAALKRAAEPVKVSGKAVAYSPSVQVETPVEPHNVKEIAALIWRMITRNVTGNFQARVDWLKGKNDADYFQRTTTREIGLENFSIAYRKVMSELLDDLANRDANAKTYVRPEVQQASARVETSIQKQTDEEVMRGALLKIARYCLGNPVRTMHNDVISIAISALNEIGVDWKPKSEAAS